MYQKIQRKVYKLFVCSIFIYGAAGIKLIAPYEQKAFSRVIFVVIILGKLLGNRNEFICKSYMVPLWLKAFEFMIKKT